MKTGRTSRRPPQECHCALQYPRAMSKVIKGLRSRVRLRGKDGCDRGALRKRKSFLLASHAIYCLLALVFCALARKLYAFIWERRKCASRDQSSRPSLTRKDGPVRSTGMVWCDENALYKTNKSEESGFRTYSRDEETKRFEAE